MIAQVIFIASFIFGITSFVLVGTNFFEPQEEVVEEQAAEQETIAVSSSIEIEKPSETAEIVVQNKSSDERAKLTANIYSQLEALEAEIAKLPEEKPAVAVPQQEVSANTLTIISEPVPPPVPVSIPAEKININTASLTELQAITGIGPVIAQNIIDYRNTDGLFYTVEDLKKVSGIGDSNFEKMRDEITVGNIPPPPAPSPAPQPAPAPTPAPEPEPTPPPSPSPASPTLSPIIINEILFNPEGSDTGKEFIKIYNPNSTDIDLTDWSLRISDEGSTETSSLAKIGSSDADKTSIAAVGFFIVGFNKNTEADVKRSTALPNTSRTVYLNNSEGATVDSVTYTESIEEGLSWQR